MDDYRKAQRNIAISARVRNRRRKGATCLCDWCGVREGTTMHEIFPRALTLENTEKRDACYHYTVISMLCPFCHSEIQSDANANRALLDFNRTLFGDAVNNHIRYMRQLGVRTSFQERDYDVE